MILIPSRRTLIERVGSVMVAAAVVVSARSKVTKSLRMVRRFGAILAFAILSTVLTVSVNSSAEAAPTNYGCWQAAACTDLTLWHSAARGDYFLTNEWRFGEDHQRDGGYVYVGDGGIIAHPWWPQPNGTVALWNWYSPSREDNFATTDPQWIPSGPNDTRSSGGALYIWPSLLGYVFTTQQQYCVDSALDMWWNPTLGDNALVPTLFGSPTFEPGYKYVGRLGFTDPGPC